MDKRIFKKTGEELQQYLAFKRKHFFVPAKKGKGSFKRQEKHSKKFRECSVMVAPFIWDEREWFESNIFDQCKNFLQIFIV